MENKNLSQNSSTLKWNDIISIDRDTYFSGNTEHPRDYYIIRTENFLNNFQSTDFGQQILNKIQDKYGNKKLEISFNDYFQSVTFPNGQISIDVRDENSLAFIDQNSCEPVSFKYERILTHELVHAADPRIELGKDNQEECHTTLVEEYATTQTDKYAELHAPELGKRAAYNNVAIAPKKDKFFQTEQGNAVDLIKNNPTLQEEINDIVINVKSAMKACIDEVQNFNGVMLPISNEIQKKNYSIPRH